MISIQCNCGRQIKVRDEHAGKAVLCPQCKQRVRIPRADRAVQSPPVASPPPPVQTRDDFEQPRRPRRRAYDDDYDRPPRQHRLENSGKALAGFILGLATFVLPVLAAVPAILLSILGLKEIKTRGGRMAGSGLAKAGLILGIAGNVSLIGYIWLFSTLGGQDAADNDFFESPVARAEAKAQSKNNLRQIAIAMHNYHDTYRRMPPAVVFDQTGKPLYSWRVLILPFIEEGNLYRQFRLNEPWDSPHNKQFLSRMPRTYRTPGKPGASPTETYYQVFVGDGTVFGPKRPVELFRIMQFGLKGTQDVKIFRIQDGTSNTILAAEAAKPVPWTAPDEIEFDSTQPFAGVGGVFKDGCNAALCDGSVRFLSFDRLSPETMRNAVNPQDGQALGADW